MFNSGNVPETLSTSIYDYRIVRGRLDHRDPGLAASSGDQPLARPCREYPMRQQSAADWRGHAPLRGRHGIFSNRMLLNERSGETGRLLVRWIADLHRFAMG